MIKRLVVQGFRGIGQALTFEFARLTFLTGRNGLGKTTVFDAIDWCLFGNAWRLGGEAAFRNLYHVAPVPKVSITMELEREYVIERDEFGARVDGEAVSDKEVVFRFVRDPEVFGPYARDEESRVRRLIYLPQAEIRELVKPAAESERVAILHSLLGVPNAAVVEKSLRRISDRMSVRERDQLSRREEVRADIDELISSGGGIAESEGVERDHEIRFAKEVLGTDAGNVESLDGLLASARASMQATQHLRTGLIGVRAWLDQASQSLTGLRTALEGWRKEIEEREALVRQETATLPEAVRARDEARSARVAARERLNKAVASIASVQRRVAQIGALEEKETTERKLAQEAAAVEAELQHRRSEALHRQGELEQLRQAAVEARIGLEVWETEESRIVEGNELERQAAGISSEVGVVRQRKAEFDVRLQEIESELVGLSARKSQADEEHRLLLSRLPARERLAALLAEISEVLTDTRPRACPLCGAVYGSADELLEHVKELKERRSDQIHALERAASEARSLEERISVLEAERTTLQSAFSDFGRKEEELVRSLRRTGSQLVAIGTRVDLASHRRRGDEIRGAISDGQRAIEQATTQMNAARAEVARHEARLQELRQDLGGEQNRIEELRDGLPSEGPTELRVAAQEWLSEAETERVAAAAALEVAGAEEQRAISKLAETEATLARLAEELADARGREARDSERVRGLRTEMAARLKGVGISSVEDADQSLREMLAESEMKERRLQRVERGLYSLIGMREQEEKRAQLAALQTRDREIGEEVDGVVRANTRFETIASAIRERAEFEAREALHHQTAAIQECLAALLPHRHLNRVIWDESSGSILVTDRLLASAVRPDLYTSTGQMNVLALSVFLGAALLQRITKWSFLALDEPVQNLDDVHFLAFVTLMKRVAGSRQIIVSTADRNVAELIRRQLKSSWEAREYVQYEWRGFEAKSGPDVVKIENRAVVVRGPLRAI